MPRYFTLRQAEELLPQIEPAIREGIDLKAEFQSADAAFRSSTARIAMLGGVDVNRTAIVEQRARRDVSAARLKRLLDDLNERGCLVKDLDMGLIDFPTLLRGEEVYLCWKLGEDSIRFWHHVADGYRGRKPIDGDFMENHRGEAEN